MERTERSNALVGKQNDAKNSLLVSYNIKQTLPVRLSSDPSPGYLLWRNENRITHKPPCECSFISNCPKLEGTQLTFNWGVDKHYAGQPHRGTLLSHKKDTGNHTDDSQRPYAE